jgi:hypothetical protein
MTTGGRMTFPFDTNVEPLRLLDARDKPEGSSKSPGKTSTSQRCTKPSPETDMTNKKSGGTQRGKSSETDKPTSGNGEDIMNDQQFQQLMTTMNNMTTNVLALQAKVETLPDIHEIENIVIKAVGQAKDDLRVEIKALPTNQSVENIVHNIRKISHRWAIGIIITVLTAAATGVVTTCLSLSGKINTNSVAIGTLTGAFNAKMGTSIKTTP